MGDASRSQTASTRLQRIVEQTVQYPGMERVDVVVVGERLVAEVTAPAGLSGDVHCLAQGTRFRKPSQEVCSVQPTGESAVYDKQVRWFERTGTARTLLPD